MIDPRTPEGRLTLRYRGLPTSVLLSMLGVDKVATNDRPFYPRNELIVTNGAIVIHTQRLKSDPGGNLLS